MLACILTKPLLLLSESNHSELFSLLLPPTIFTSYTSTAKMPSCMGKATLRSIFHNQKALWMNGSLNKLSISTSLSTALNRLLVSGIFSFAEWDQNSSLWHWKRIPAFTLNLLKQLIYLCCIQPSSNHLGRAHTQQILAANTHRGNCSTAFERISDRV